MVTAFARYALECRAVEVEKVLKSDRPCLTRGKVACLGNGWVHTLSLWKIMGDFTVLVSGLMPTACLAWLGVVPLLWRGGGRGVVLDPSNFPLNGFTLATYV